MHFTKIGHKMLHDCHFTALQACIVLNKAFEETYQYVSIEGVKEVVTTGKNN